MELAVAAIGLIAPYLGKAADEFAKQVGGEAVNAVRRLADKLRSWWSDDPVAKAAAENMAADPARNAKFLAESLATKLDEDTDFAREVEQLVKDAAPYAEVVQRIEFANGVTGADIEEIVGGHLRVEQDVTNAQNLTGIKAKRLG